MRSVAFWLTDTFIWDIVDGAHIGGREWNVVRIAEELARLDWQVTIYCPIQTPRVKHDVTYRPLAYPDEDVLVVVNGYEVLKEVPDTYKVVWVPTGVPVLQDYQAVIDQVVASSPAKKAAVLRFNPWLLDDQVTPIFSGTDPELYAHPVSRQANRLLWCSARDRGLHHLLRWWPRLREKIPDLTLHVTYDPRALDPWRWQMEVRTEVSRLVDQGVHQEGITDLGAVSSADLVKEQQECSLWACPVEFYGGLETGSFTVVEMSAARTPMLLSPDASVMELGHDAAHFLPFPIQDTMWINRIVELLQDETERRKFEPRQAEIAAQYTWASAAQQWDALLEDR